MNWKHEELRALDDANAQLVGALLSAPRAAGKCQALMNIRADGYRELRCMECGYECAGMPEEIVPLWNGHIIYR